MVKQPPRTELEPAGCNHANLGVLADDTVKAWFAEAHRLFIEAEERLGLGNVLPALSSLAAVPPLH
jgi:hypothetical protein